APSLRHRSCRLECTFARTIKREGQLQCCESFAKALQATMIYKLGSINSNREGYQTLAEFWSVASLLLNGSLELDLSNCASLDANMAAALGMVLALITDKL